MSAVGYLKGATNHLGPLSDDMKERIYRFMDKPTRENWEEIYCIIVCNKALGGTIWTAVCNIDPTFPRSAPSGKDLKKKWPKVPDVFTVARAIKTMVEAHGRPT